MMRRACVITHPVVVNDGKPFDAFIVELFRHDTDLEFFILYKGCLLGSYFKCENLKDLRVSYAFTQWQLAQALNTPIKVTQAVLDAMEKVPEAKFLVCGDYDYFGAVLGDYIQADCPLALQVLLQFTLEGVRIKEGG